MAPKLWNTYRLCLYGALAGAAYGIAMPHYPWALASSEMFEQDAGGVAGAAVGGAILAAIISGLRNLAFRNLH